MPIYVQALILAPYPVGSPQEKEYRETLESIAIHDMLTKTVGEEEPRRRIGVWQPIMVLPVAECAALEHQGIDWEGDHYQPTMCEECKDGWESDYLITKFRHGTPLSVGYGCTCTKCESLGITVHPGELKPTEEDTPRGASDTFPGEDT